LTVGGHAVGVSSPGPARPALGLARSILVFAVAAVLLAGAALYNGYPLVHWDTGTYVSSSFTFAVPLRRPVAYGVFLALTHGGITLWTVVLAQALLTTALIRRLFADAPWRDGTLLLATAALALLTSLPWFIGQVMPDALAGAGVLACFLLLRRPSRSLATRLAEGAVVVLAAAVHHSHLPLLLSLVAVATAVKLLFPRLELALRPAWIAVLTAAVAIPSLNFALTGEFFYTKAAHAFVLGRMVGNGLVGELLEENCDTNDYTLCPYREELRLKGRSFLWDRGSSFHRTGGWQAPSGPAWRMIVDSLRHDPVGHASAIAINTARQLVRFDADELVSYPPDEYVSKMVRVRFPGEADAFARARQQEGTLPLAVVLPVHRVVVWVSAALSAVLLLAAFRGARPAALDLHVFVWTALVLNAAIMSNLSAVSGRYQSRIVWLLPLAVSVTAIHGWLARSRRRGSAERAALLQPSLRPDLPSRRTGGDSGRNAALSRSGARS
jgi:hypothetical protein